MTEKELVDELAAFALVLQREVKGITTNITWHLYGTDADYIVALNPASEDNGHIEVLDKSRVDWETYIVMEGAGALAGHMTGKPERRPGGGAGGLEERRDRNFIHQLLGPNFSTLLAHCETRHPALSARAAIMATEPNRTAPILFYQEYLRINYQTVAGSNVSFITEHLTRFPGAMKPSDLIAKWEEIEHKLKLEKRSVVFEVTNGAFRIFEKDGKENRLVNGWLFGIEHEESETDAPAEAQRSSYEREIEGAGFYSRMKALMSEAELLLGEFSAETIGVIADQKSGALSKTLLSLEQFSSANLKDIGEPQKKALMLMAERGEKLAEIASHKGRVLTAFGIKPEDLAACGMRAQKIRRKLA